MALWLAGVRMNSNRYQTCPVAVILWRFLPDATLRVCPCNFVPLQLFAPATAIPLVARKADGSLVAWGNNVHDNHDADWKGRPVTGTPSGPGYTGVAAGRHHAVAIRSDGSLVSWGQCTYTPLGTDFKEVAAGHGHRCAHPSLGIATYANSLMLPPARSLALKQDGSLASWGCDGMSGTPGGTGFCAVTAGDEMSIALKQDGSLVSWGSDEFRQVKRTPFDILS
eukprot:gene12971-biopygen6727